MADKYNYEGISEEAKQFAVKELNESPEQVNAHIESFRRWVNSMNHLNCPTDSLFLLRFLRVAKFDHSKAQKRLDNFCTVRSSSRGSPEFFKYHNYSDPVFQKFLDWKIHIPLGRCNSGEFVLLISPKNWNVDEIPLLDFVRCILMDMDFLLTDQHMQIYGVKIILNFQSMPRKTFETWADPSFMKSWMRIIQETFPFRIKGLIFYNEPVLMDIAFKIMEFFMNEKLKSRVFRIKNDINKAIDKVPGLQDILPTEYNGKGGSVDSIVDKLKSDVKEYFKNGNPLANISVDDDKRPQETVKYFTEYRDYDGPLLGTSGTYTQYKDVY